MAKNLLKDRASKKKAGDKGTYQPNTTLTPKGVLPSTPHEIFSAEQTIMLSNIPGAYIQNFSWEIFNKINFDDKKFILREAPYEVMKEDVEIEALNNSIMDIGLINPIYLQNSGVDKFRIVSGYRRSCAISLASGDQPMINAKFIIVPATVTPEELDVLQVNENSHRDDLKTIELAYKLHSYAERNNVSMNKAAEKYNLSISQGKKVASSVNYPLELKLVLDDVGPSKAVELNKLIKLLNYEMSTQEIVDTYKDKTKADIEAKIREIKKGIKKEYMVHKRTKNNFSITVQESLSEDEIQGLLDLVDTYVKDLKK